MIRSPLVTISAHEIETELFPSLDPIGDSSPLGVLVGVVSDPLVVEQAVSADAVMRVGGEVDPLVLSESVITFLIQKEVKLTTSLHSLC